MSLPPGQFELKSMPRFGLPRYASRFPDAPTATTLAIAGSLANPTTLDLATADLPRTELVADFHCVTTWSVRQLHWSGFAFINLYDHLLGPLAGPSAEVSHIVFTAQDGYRAALPLADLRKADVLIADRCNGQPLTIASGAPFRLIAPAHYGYKQVKHLKAIRCLEGLAGYRPAGLPFMEHPRARVAHEERAVGVPGWLLRPLYRALIGPTRRRFARALAAREYRP